MLVKVYPLGCSCEYKSFLIRVKHSQRPLEHSFIFEVLKKSAIYLREIIRGVDSNGKAVGGLEEVGEHEVPRLSDIA